MNPNSTPPGWYPDPSGMPMQRYFDGAQWTDDYAPAATASPPLPAPAVGGVVTPGPNHGLHLALTLFTCGVWLPIWIFVALTSNRQPYTVDVYGNPIRRPVPSRNPGDPAPTAFPRWMDNLPGPPGLWVAVLVVALLVVGFILTGHPSK